LNEKQMTLFTLAAAAFAAGVWYVWSNEGGTHTITLDQIAYADNGYSPYAWWATHGGRGEAYVHHFPDKVAPNCLPEIFSTEVGTLATTLSEVAMPRG
jgi:hypothetical protein